MAQRLPFHLQFQRERRLKGWSQEDVAERLNCDLKTIGRWEHAKAQPQPFHRQKICEIFGKSAEEMGLMIDPPMEIVPSVAPTEVIPIVPPTEPLISLSEDWGVAPHVTNFYGRDAERDKLVQWIQQDRCQVVTVLGMGGVGKSTLTRKVAEQIKGSFEFIFWRSLQNAPSLSSILKSCIYFVSRQHQVDFPETIDAQILLLTQYLRDHRCLIILDNVESILQPGQRAGQYRDGYGDYGLFIQRIGEVDHRSCLLLTSREKPKDVGYLEGTVSLVRSLPLSGVHLAEGQQILQDKGLFGSDIQWATLVHLYSGNPLALKLVSEFIVEVFAGNIARFLQEEEIAFGDINDLLDQHFQRLSNQEQEIMYWLAIERELASLEDLSLKLAFPLSKQTLMDSLHSLRRRSIIEVGGPALFMLQPVIMEYMTLRLVNGACEDFEAGRIGLWAKFAFMLSQTKDYVRDSQVRLILAPIARYLLSAFGRRELEIKLYNVLTLLRQDHTLQSGYAVGNIINLMVYLHYDLRDADFSHLPIKQAHLRNVPLPGVNFSASSFSVSTFTNASGSVLSLAFSPTQDYFATGTATGDIWVYEVQTGTPVFSCHGHSDGVWSLAFSPDGRLLASSSDDQSIRLWSASDPSTGQCQKVLQDEMDRVRAIAFSPDGSLLASGSDDYVVRLWEVQSGQCRSLLRGHTDRVWSVAFSPNGRFLASGSNDQTIRLWDMQDLPLQDTAGDSCLKIFQGHSGWIRSLAFSPDGRTLVSGSDDQTVGVWNVLEEDDPAEQPASFAILRGHTAPVWSVAFSPDGSMFASSSEDQTLRLWGGVDGSSLSCLRILQGHTRGVRSVAFNRDGSILASGGEDQACRLWEAKSGFCLQTLQGYTNWVWSLVFRADSAMLASCNEDRTIRLWTGMGDGGQVVLAKVLQDRVHGGRAIAFHPAGQMLASAGEDHTVRLWDVNSGLCINILRAHTGWVRAVAFSPDGTFLASGGEDQGIHLWSVCSASLQTILTGHTHWVRSLAFHPAGQMLASGGDDQTIRFWDLTTGEDFRILQGHTSRIRFISFSPDGEVLASCAEDRIIRLWNTATGQCIDILRGHSNWVRCVAFSPDGHMLASSSEDQIRLWQKDDQHVWSSRILQGHTNRIRCVAFSPDGRFLVSCSDDGSIRFWNWQSGQTTQTLINERPYEQMNISGVRGVTEAQKSALRALGAFEDASG